MSDDGTNDDADEFGDVFGLLGSDVRVDILRALWDERTAVGGRPEPVAFSTLRERVDVSDSGRFNYHLGKLVPEFVEEVEDGYTLTYAGRQVIGAIVSGSYTDADATTAESVAFSDCIEADCDGTNEISYDGGKVAIRCDTCDRAIVEATAPPIIVGAHDVESNPDTFGDFFLTRVQKRNRGFCTLCDGPIEMSIARFHPEHDVAIEDSVDVVHECRECGTTGHVSAIATVFGHPAMISLLHDVGIDYRNPWERPAMLDAVDHEVREDPNRAELTVALDGESLTITLDEDVDVVGYERE